MNHSMTSQPTERAREDELLLRELTALAEAIHRRRHWHVKQWRPLGTPRGVLSQIDNMVAGLLDDIEATPPPPEDAVEAVARAICKASSATWKGGTYEVASGPNFEMEKHPLDRFNNHWRYKARAAIAAMPSSAQESDAGVTEEMRDEIVAAYKQGALDVHNAWIEGCGEENAPSRDPDFTEAAHDYAAMTSARDRRG